MNTWVVGIENNQVSSFQKNIVIGDIKNQVGNGIENV
jgi:hypothetical protein